MTDAHHQSAEHHASKFTSKQRTIALIIVAFAFVMDLLDNTIVNIAIPSIQANLGVSYAVIQWLIAGYALAFAVLLITGGRMGDVFGYKKLFMIGVAGFTLASLLSGCAWNSGILIAARLLQGAMAALMVPQVMSLMQVMYKQHERGAVMGIFGALAGVAASLGPVVGGLLIHLNIAGLDWRPIFLINIPVGIFAILAGIKYLPDGKSPHPLKLDIVGTGIIMTAMFLLVFPLIEGRDLGWPTWSFAMMASSVLGLVVFAWWQVKKDARDNSPLVVPALLRSRTFLTGLSVNIIFEGAMIGFFLPFTLILQVGLGFSVVKAALTGIPTAIGISVAMATFAQKIIPKLGRYTMTIGTIVMISGLGILYALIHHSQLHTSPWEFAPGLLVVGVGMALIMSPMFSVVLTDVDPKHAGSASGVLNAVQQLGGALGTALIGVVFFGSLTSQAPASFTAATPQIKTALTSQHVPTGVQDQMLSAAKACFIDHTTQKDSSATPQSCKALQNNSSASSAVGKALTDGAKTANARNFVTAFKAAIAFEAAILTIVFLLSFLLPRHISRQAMEEAL